jgi:hypothetical protein
LHGAQYVLRVQFAQCLPQQREENWLFFNSETVSTVLTTAVHKTELIAQYITGFFINAITSASMAIIPGPVLNRLMRLHHLWRLGHQLHYYDP